MDSPTSPGDPVVLPNAHSALINNKLDEFVLISQVSLIFLGSQLSWSISDLFLTNDTPIF